MKKAFKILLTFLAMLLCFSANAVYYNPMPIMIPSGGGGDCTPKQALAVYIVSMIPSVILYISYSIMWLFKRNNRNIKFVEYVIWSDFGEFKVDGNTIWFASINFVAIFSLAIIYVSSLL